MIWLSAERRVSVQKDLCSRQGRQVDTSTPKVRVSVRSIAVFEDLTIVGAALANAQLQQGTSYNPRSQGDSSLLDCKGENGLEFRPTCWYKRTAHCDRREGPSRMRHRNELGPISDGIAELMIEAWGVAQGWGQGQYAQSPRAEQILYRKDALMVKASSGLNHKNGSVVPSNC